MYRGVLRGQAVGMYPHANRFPTCCRKVSVYPVGMVTSSQITRLDCGVKIGQFLRTIMPSHYVRENSARIVLGAFNAFRKVRRLDRQFPRKHSAAKHNPTMGVTFFLEDVECDEMHNYANHVASVIASAAPSATKIQSMHGINWGGKSPGACSGSK